MVKPLRLSTSQHDGTVIVTVAGELDVATSPDLKSCLDKVLLARPGQVIVDLSQCSFIDARGLGTLVTAENRAQLQHTALLLAGVPARVLRLMKLVELDSSFTFVPPTAGAARTRHHLHRAIRTPNSAAQPGRGGGRRRTEPGRAC